MNATKVTITNKIRINMIWVINSFLLSSSLFMLSLTLSHRTILLWHRVFDYFSIYLHISIDSHIAWPVRFIVVYIVWQCLNPIHIVVAQLHSYDKYGMWIIYFLHAIKRLLSHTRKVIKSMHLIVWRKKSAADYERERNPFPNNSHPITSAHIFFSLHVVFMALNRLVYLSMEEMPFRIRISLHRVNDIHSKSRESKQTAGGE